MCHFEEICNKIDLEREQQSYQRQQVEGFEYPIKYLVELANFTFTWSYLCEEDFSWHAS